MKKGWFAGITFFFTLLIFSNTAAADTDLIFQRPFIAGCAQIFVEPDVEKNLEKILNFIETAHSRGVELLVFPETALSGYAPKHYINADIPDKAELDVALEKICAAAEDASMWLILGTTEYEKDGIYNTVLLIDSQGKVRKTYAKAHLTSGDDDYYQFGKNIHADSIGGVKYGMQICFDLRFPEPWRLQAQDGARVIFHSAFAAGDSPWKVPVWEGHLRSRAAENSIWVISCNVAGPIQMGRSYIINPNGLLVAASNGEVEELISGEVDLSQRGGKFIDHRRSDLFELKYKD